MFLSWLDLMGRDFWGSKKEGLLSELGLEKKPTVSMKGIEQSTWEQVIMFSVLLLRLALHCSELIAYWNPGRLAILELSLLNVSLLASVPYWLFLDFELASDKVRLLKQCQSKNQFYASYFH